MRLLLDQKLDELPKSFRTVFVLRSVEELSIEETAKCLSVPEARQDAGREVGQDAQQENPDKAGQLLRQTINNTGRISLPPKTA